MKQITPERAKETREYRKLAQEFLAAHPLCQATLLEYGIPEEHALHTIRGLLGGGNVPWKGRKFFVPFATEIHHRNKRHGSRLTDTRWFLAVSRVQHDFIERFKSEARKVGWSLDVSCDPDGRTPGGVQALTTAEMFARLEELQNRPENGFIGETQLGPRGGPFVSGT